MNLNKNILFLNFGIGATCVKQWLPQNLYFKRMVKRINNFINLTHLKIDYIIYHQGECDNNENTPYKVYKQSLSKIMKTLYEKYNAKIILNIASRNIFRKDINITKAQTDIISEYDFILKGVNTDKQLSCLDDRYGVHFSKKGLKKFGKLLSNIILQVEGYKK